MGLGSSAPDTPSVHVFTVTSAHLVHAAHESGMSEVAMFTDNDPDCQSPWPGTSCAGAWSTEVGAGCPPFPARPRPGLWPEMKQRSLSRHGGLLTRAITWHRSHQARGTSTEMFFSRPNMLQNLITISLAHLPFSLNTEVKYSPTSSGYILSLPTYLFFFIFLMYL